MDNVSCDFCGTSSATTYYLDAFKLRMLTLRGVPLEEAKLECDVYCCFCAKRARTLSDCSAVCGNCDWWALVDEIHGMVSISPFNGYGYCTRFPPSVPVNSIMMYPVTHQSLHPCGEYTEWSEIPAKISDILSSMGLTEV